MTARIDVTETYQQMLELRVNELLQENGYLQDKLAEMVTGGLTRCVAAGCNAWLGERLLAGYATCSDRCTAKLRPLVGTQHGRQITYQARYRERKRLEARRAGYE